MVDAVTEHFEHYLAWTVGALVELVNTRLADAGIEARLCPDLGSYIRYGVDDPKALILMTSGIRSRRLATCHRRGPACRPRTYRASIYAAGRADGRSRVAHPV